MENIFTKGLENAPKRSLLKSTGMTDSDLEKPLIGIIYSKNETVSGHSDPDRLLQCIKEGIISAGAKPLLATTMSICSGISMGASGKYLLPSRELIADSIETVVYGSGFDAVVYVGSCDSTVPAMLLAAARINIPCIFVSPGTSPAGFYGGKKTGFSSVLEGVYGLKSGKISASDYESLEDSCCPSSGSGSEMSTSNTMCCITEALGLALAHNGTYPANSAKRFALAKQSGEQIVFALKNQLTPRRIIDIPSLINAVRFIMAAGGSIDTLMHLTALAYELKINADKYFSYDTIEKISAETPSLSKLAPASSYYIEDFDRAGGVMAVLKELLAAKLLNANAITVTGAAIGEYCSQFENKNREIINSCDKPINKKGAAAILYGNIAEEGCLIRKLFVSDKAMAFTGTAKVFDSEEDALFALSNGNITEGDCVVVRYEGPKGSPGMREMRAISSAIAGAGLENKVALITDGRTGGTSKGYVIGHVCPEAAEQGNIAFIENGDKIEIDINKGKINMDVPAKIIAARKKKFKPKMPIAGGYLLRYSELVTSSKKGAVMKDKF